MLILLAQHRMIFELVLVDTVFGRSHINLFSMHLGLPPSGLNRLDINGFFLSGFASLSPEFKLVLFFDLGIESLHVFRNPNGIKLLQMTQVAREHILVTLIILATFL